MLEGVNVNVFKFLKNRLQISLQVLSEFKRNELTSVPYEIIRKP